MSISAAELDDTRGKFLAAAFLHTEGIEVDAQSLCYRYGYDYAVQIDMGDGKGFQTCWSLPGYDLEQALAHAAVLSRKRKHPQRVIRRDFFTTIINHKQLQNNSGI